MFLRALIRGYQLLLSPVLPGACRFYPTCSEYAAEAVARWGAVRGGWLAVKRIGRCHPWAARVSIPSPPGIRGWPADRRIVRTIAVRRWVRVRRRHAPERQARRSR